MVEVPRISAVNRKRKRRVIMMPLDAPAAELKAALLEKRGKNMADVKFTAGRLNARTMRQMVEVESICPIRIDVKLNGIRFQDTLLVDAYVCTKRYFLGAME